VIAAFVAQHAADPRPPSTLLPRSVDVMSTGVAIVLVLTVVVHVGFAIAVWRDARRVRPVLAGALLWTLATLVGGVFVAVAYWFVQHFAVGTADSVSPPRNGPRRP
jgi:Na+/H+ antiporter NhaD/arsenite permease-like protein